MSSVNRSTCVSSGRRHLVVGTARLAVGTLEIGDVTKIARVWTSSELASKCKGGLPRGFAYVHIVTGTPGAIVKGLNQAAQAMTPRPEVNGPEDESIIEARLRAFLNLPAIASPVVSSVLNPLDYFKSLAQVAVAKQAAAEVARDCAENEALKALEERDRLLARLEPLTGCNGRLSALIARLWKRNQNARLALAIVTRPVTMTPQEFEVEWREMSLALAAAHGRVAQLEAKLAERAGEVQVRGTRASTLTKARERIGALEARLAESEELAKNRAKRIKSLQAQLARADEQFADVSGAFQETLLELQRIQEREKGGRPKKKR